MEYQLIRPSLPHKKDEDVVERVFLNRGLNAEDMMHYLYTTDADIINPATIMNIENGVKMLIKHINNSDKTLMIIDADADGFTSSALFLNYLFCHFPSYIQNCIAYKLHSGKQHGIEEDFLDEIIRQEYKFVICIDSSSNDYMQHEFLHNKGIDVLVIDHHEADKESEYACVINNQLCDYPTKSLSGVGMAYKFCSFIDSLLNTNYANNYLDLVAIGMVADVMDLRDFETRHLVVKGLSQIRNPFFKKLVEVQDFSIKKAGGLGPFAIGFYISPQVNATIRMGSMEEKLILFESMLDYRGYELIPSTKRGCKGQVETRVEQACRNCNNIKNRQTKARDASLNVIEQVIEEKKLLENKILAIQIDPSNPINKNLTGLIANQLMAKYNHPVLLLNRTIDKDGRVAWEGSARGYETGNLNDFRNFMLDYAFYAAGHAFAFGAGIYDSDYDSFVEKTNEILADYNFTPRYNVDFIWDAYDFNPNDIIQIAKLNTVWGQGLTQPYVVLENVAITTDSIQLMSKDKNPTLKITLPNETSLIKFGSSNEEYESLLPSELGCVKVNIVGTCYINEWNGKINPQIQINNYEIVGHQKYYF